MKRGLTLIEVIIALAILTLIISVSILSFYALNRRSALDASTSTIKSALSEARSKTLAGVGESQYGVHFASTSITLFKGSSYNAGHADNVLSSLHSAVTVSGLSFASGGTDIVFNRLTGETDQCPPCTVTLTSGGDGVVITIYGTGVVE